MGPNMKRASSPRAYPFLLGRLLHSHYAQAHKLIDPYPRRIPHPSLQPSAAPSRRCAQLGDLHADALAHSDLHADALAHGDPHSNPLAHGDPHPDALAQGDPHSGTPTLRTPTPAPGPSRPLADTYSDAPAAARQLAVSIPHSKLGGRGPGSSRRDRLHRLPGREPVRPRREDGAEKVVLRGGGPITGEAVVIDGIAYVSSLDHNLYAIDTRRRTTMWTFETGDKLWRGPVVADGVVYVGSKDASVYAVDAATATSSGSTIRAMASSAECGSTGTRCCSPHTTILSTPWTHPTVRYGGERPWEAAPRLDQVSGTARCTSETSTAGCMPSTSETGRSLWTQWLGETDIWASPVVHGDLVLVGATDGRLYALPTTTAPCGGASPRKAKSGRRRR